MSIASPCISVCRMSVSLALRCGESTAARNQGLCEGCLRSIAEIALWGSLSDADKRQVLSLIDDRKKKLTG